MSGSVETIKDFLLSLGFAVDESGYKKFGSVLTDVTRNALKLGATVEGAALAVVGFSAHIASGLDKVYWAAERTGASAQAIKSLGYAMSQAGGSAAGAQAALDSMARFLRNQPGAEGWLNHLGVSTRDAQGHLHKTETLLTGVSQRLSQMPFYRANQYAQMLGIDENTLLALRRGIGHYAAEYQMAAQKIGFNAEEAAKQSNVFMTALHSFGMIAGQVKDKIGANLAGGLAGELDTLKKRLLDNFPKIEKTLTTTLKGILALAGALTRLLYRGMQGVGQIIDWWEHLDSSNKKLIAGFGALLVAWRVLNSAFLLSPIGIILSLTAAIGLLYDDYMTWKEGGKSLIDWKQWQPDIEKAKAAIKNLVDWLKQGKDAVGGWQNVFKALAIYIGGRWVMIMLSAIKRVSRGFAPLLAAIAAVDAFNKVSELQNEAKKRGMTEAEVLLDRMREKDKEGETFTRWLFSWLPEKHPRAPKLPRKGEQVLNNLQPVFEKLEALHQLPMGLLRSVAKVESSGNPFAISPKGAKGLFQFMPDTAKEMGLKGTDAYNPVKSAEAAAKYLGWLLKLNEGNLEKTLASYNWGIGNVKRHGMLLMPSQTRDYIPRVMGNMPTAGGIHQETNIHINGATDPIATGMDIAGRQTGVNATLVQQVNARVR